MTATVLPKLPVAHDELVNYIASHPEVPVRQLMEPYRQFEAKLREVYAQERTNPILDDPYLNILPVFNENTLNIKTRARNPEAEPPAERNRYIMVLPDDKRRKNGSPAVVESLREFRDNFSVFSESSLADMDWSNIVAAGSSVVNCLLPVPVEYKKSKRALRQYYHEKFCPASDVDLFLYGLTEEQAIEKIKDIEARVRDAILSEVTVVRTKNAITICSQYPTRHIQIVLRVYKSVSEILTGFDIDCSGAAYDGEQVYCTPRALASYITQINPIDLSRRSPSYENRLSKYSHRNFEVYWQELDRSRIDPTIYERSFQRTLGLARLLILERLPTTSAREEYLRKRREERGRPGMGYRYYHRLAGNIKDNHEDEVADWVDEEEVSNYHTFTVPYGAKFHAKKIEKLCYTKDLLLNAEWNQPKEREIYLHRHPAFFGRVKDVIEDCCGTCPKAKTPEEVELAEKESEIYVSGRVSFRIDDPGRQQIGSFNPLTEDDWTEMAYVGNTARLCQAIVDEDLEHVEDWLSQEGADPNRRDYTGRTPLHLAVMSSTPEIVKCLVDHGARLIARLADGRTALHLAAGRGNVEIVKVLLEKSAANEEEEEEKRDQRRKALYAAHKEAQEDNPEEVLGVTSPNRDSDHEDSDGEMVSIAASDDDVQTITTASFVKVDKDDAAAGGAEPAALDDQGEPDFYKIDVVAWDSHCSPLHLAILGGHCETVKLLCQEFGADVLLPIKFGEGTWDHPHVVILSMVLALALSVDKAIRMTETLLSLGATSSQADMYGVTAFHRFVHNGVPELIEKLWENDKIGVKAALNHLAVQGTYYSNGPCASPLLSAIENGDAILVLKLLDAGAKPQIEYDSWLRGAKQVFERDLRDYGSNLKLFRKSADQPLIVAIRSPNPSVAIDLLERGADPNALTKVGHRALLDSWAYAQNKGESALDVTRNLLDKFREYADELSGLEQTSEPGKPPAFYSTVLGKELIPPLEPLGAPEFLAKFTEGTYQHWLVSRDIAKAHDTYKQELETFGKQRAKALSGGGLKMKLEAVEDIISQLERVEKALEVNGAKTFKELHPQIQGPITGTPQHLEQKPYSLEFTFGNVVDITDARKAAYIKLFEAAWAGDLETIKSLTLASWDADQQEPPLKVAVWDNSHNNPVSLAFLRGHYAVAKAILEIAQAQWAPADEKTTRFTMNGDPEGESDGDSYNSDCDSNEDGLGVREKVIEDQFTIENVGQVSMKVKSQTLASAVLTWATPTFTLRDGVLKNTDHRENLITFAIRENDVEAFKFLINLSIQLAREEPVTDNESSRFYTLPRSDFDYAVRLGRIEMLAEAIRRTGAGIPLEDLVKKTGTELKVKPRYYQGLNVYGKKRADWANAGRNLMHRPRGGNEAPPLLTAAAEGSLESAEWFISDAPMRHYAEFGKSKVAKEDPRLKHLNEARGGFDRAIAKWLGVQNDLAIHCVVIRAKEGDANRVLEYLIRVCPASLEAKSAQGYTPLFLACRLGRVEFVKALIDAGADQSVKDKELNTIVHAALRNRPHLIKLRELLNLLDPDLRSHMFLQRNTLSSGGNTPLHYWLREANPLIYTWDYSAYSSPNRCLDREKAENVEVLRLILEFSGGAELDILNGSGDTILHTAVILHLPEHIRVILAQNFNLIYRENAVGRTPSEIAYDIWINSRVETAEKVVASSDDGTEITRLKKRCPRDFLENGSKGAKKPRPDRKKLTWDLFEEHLAKGSAKRRLVSLNEANDVAKRLGERYASQRYFWKGPKTEEEDDEEPKPQQEEEQVADYVQKNYADSSAWHYPVEKPDAYYCFDCETYH
ncbi:ankyrin [Durotheca rogersii]|uniref:ankyrin n=1 Tax=Durotheca rogersii TaxID=419775 RepID=UPI00221F67F4|nr:ankyrin [Durotheca rogersii]KAI5862660.1 ankyrin [Durotheca rogersii]